MSAAERRYITPIAARDLSRTKSRVPHLWLGVLGHGGGEEYNLRILAPEESPDALDLPVAKGRVHVPKLAPTRLEIEGTKTVPASGVANSRLWAVVRDFAGQNGIIIPNTMYGGNFANRMWAYIPSDPVQLSVGEDGAARVFELTPIAFAAAGLRLAYAHISAVQQA